MSEYDFIRGVFRSLCGTFCILCGALLGEEKHYENCEFPKVDAALKTIEDMEHECCQVAAEIQLMCRQDGYSEAADLCQERAEVAKKEALKHEKHPVTKASFETTACAHQLDAEEIRKLGKQDE